MKKIFIALVTGALLLTPALSYADTASTTSVQTPSPELLSNYLQLIDLLKAQIQLKANPEAVVLTRVQAYGTAPAPILFNLYNPTGYEFVSFGDGLTSTSKDCARNAVGMCDISKPFAHTYTLPGTYTVTLFKAVGKDREFMASTTITIFPPQK